MSWRSGSLWPWVVLLLCLSATGYSWQLTARYLENLTQERFDSRVRQIASAIEERLYSNRTILQGGVAFFAANDGRVGREQWRTYVEKLQITEHYRDIQGIGFVSLLRPGESPAGHDPMKDEGVPGSPSSGPERALIVYLESFGQCDCRAIGQDLYSDPLRRAAMERARDSGQAVLSEMVRLPMDNGAGDRAGFLLFLPVYREELPHNTVGERRGALLGYVYSTFLAGDLLESIFKGGFDDIDLEIYDGLKISSGTLMYDSDETGTVAEFDEPGRYATRRILEMHGHRWTLIFTSLPVFESKVDRFSPQLILFAGTLLSLLLFGMFWLQDRARLRLSAKTLELDAEIRERELLEEWLSEAKNQAEAANRAKSEFLANMSHELRTPLNSVIGFTRVLKDQLFGPLNDKQQEYLRDVEAGGERLLELINDLLDLAAVEAGRVVVNRGSFLCLDLLQVSKTMVQGAAAEKGVELELETDLPADLILEADERKLRQVLFNLLSNAVKFTPCGGRVTLGARFLDGVQGGGGEWLELAVADTGIGIRQEEMERLFLAFSQLEPTYTKTHKGSGLGLVLSKRLVEMQGGTIRVESEFGRGSRFLVTIPTRPGILEERSAAGESGKVAGMKGES